VLIVGIGTMEAGAATMMVPSEVPEPATVILYGVAPGGRIDKLVTKR
jgi:hypothetical protein